MSYCAADDVMVYAPQGQAILDASATALDPWIAEAGGIIDAHLRGMFVVPLFGGVEADVDQFVKSAAAKLTAGLLLRSKLSQKSKDPHPYAERLIEEGMDAIALIKADLTMIDSPLRATDGDALITEQLEVTIAAPGDVPVFELNGGIFQ